MQVRRSALIGGLSFAMLLAGVAPALAADPNKDAYIEIKTQKFDPNKAHDVTAKWQHDIGQPDSEDGKQHNDGLLFAKTGPRENGSAAVGIINGFYDDFTEGGWDF